jgi:hypothetical protein
VLGARPIVPGMRVFLVFLRCQQQSAARGPWRRRSRAGPCGSRPRSRGGALANEDIVRDDGARVTSATRAASSPAVGPVLVLRRPPAWPRAAGAGRPPGSGIDGSGAVRAPGWHVKVRWVARRFGVSAAPSAPSRCGAATIQAFSALRTFRRIGAARRAALDARVPCSCRCFSRGVATWAEIRRVASSRPEVSGRRRPPDVDPAPAPAHQVGIVPEPVLDALRRCAFVSDLLTVETSRGEERCSLTRVWGEARAVEAVRGDKAGFTVVRVSECPEGSPRGGPLWLSTEGAVPPPREAAAGPGSSGSPDAWKRSATRHAEPVSHPTPRTTRQGSPGR